MDVRLDRTVAIKTLPEHFSNDPQRIERFKREARIVSSLNHPHICTLHDIGMQDDIHYLVMEHIEGETLEKRLERGALPLARAIEYSIQIVDALDRAHRLGVIHRDLKPANVMLTKSGVKVLDFGLAARYTPAVGVAADEANHDGSKALTVEGTILGTLPYISPEQLEGRSADARTDIFAFGAVVYEMITGIGAFRAENQARLIGAILKDDPRPIVDVGPDVPVPLAQALSRCLAKDPDERWQTANDLLFQLRSIAASPAAIEIQESKSPRIRRRAERALWAAVVVASVAGTWLWARGRDVRPPAPVHGIPAIRYTLSPAEGTAFFSGYDLPFALSPDGRHIVYVGVKADATKELWLRSLSSELEQPIPGTEGASSPFWSPDSQWIGFFAGKSLKKVRVSSGLVQVVASNVTTYGGASWNADDVIIFPPTRPGGLSRVSDAGGERFLIDAGRGFMQRPVQAGCSMNAVTKLFVTHLHSDHIAGVPALMLTLWPLSRNGGCRSSLGAGWHAPYDSASAGGVRLRHSDVRGRGRKGFARLHPHGVAVGSEPTVPHHPDAARPATRRSAFRRSAISCAS